MNWLLFLVFIEEKFNLSAEFCSNIEQHTQDPIYGDVEKEVNINNRYTFKLYYRYYYFVVNL